MKLRNTGKIIATFMISFIAGVVALAALAVPAAAVPASAVAPVAAVEPIPCLPSHVAGVTLPTEVTMVTGELVEVDCGQQSGGTGTGRCLEVQSVRLFDKDTITVTCDRGQVEVVPGAATGLLGSSVGRNLFNVTTLVSSGYDDWRVTATPLIVQYADQATASAAFAGTSGLFGDALLDKQYLGIINGVAGKLPRTEAGAIAFRRLLADLRAERTAGVKGPVRQISLNSVITIT